MTVKCIWCKEKKPDEEFDKPILGVCKICIKNTDARHTFKIEKEAVTEKATDTL